MRADNYISLLVEDQTAARRCGEYGFADDRRTLALAKESRSRGIKFKRYF